jgi:ATP-dependent DNA helicase RecQ
MLAVAETTPLDEARGLLRRIWGHPDFRGLQGEVISEILAGRDALAVLPTGGGKSVCYQIPSLMRPGVGLVVSPLIALMSDQVLALRQLGVRAARLDSSLPPGERGDVLRSITAGELDLVYLAPEGLIGGALERLSNVPIAVVAIDEAHCVSQWGHDFRPDYRSLGRLGELFPGAPRLAVTATADARTREDVRRSLKLENAREFVASFDRPNLILKAERKHGGAQKRVLDLVAARPNRSGIVYAGSRDSTERLAEALRKQGAPALAYHAGLDKTVRNDRLHEFLQEEDRVMTATIAFGMGVDKPDVRYVIHADPPGSIEAYWQEVGRGGRDGEPAEGITLYDAGDMAWALRRIGERPMEEEVKAVQVAKVRRLYAMLDGLGCRPAAVRRYFGEEGVEACGRCDLCTAPPSGVDATQAAQKALSAVHRLGGRFGRGRIVDHLLGKTKEPSSFETAMTTFGIGRDMSPQSWRDLLEQLLFEGLLLEDANEGRPLIGLGDPAAVKAVYRGERQVKVRKEPEAFDPATRSGRPRKRTREMVEAATGDDAGLFNALKAWRRDIAAVQGVPPYVVFHDRTLLEIARGRPGSLSELAGIGGVGEGKLGRYGEAVLKVVRGAG